MKDKKTTYEQGLQFEEIVESIFGPMNVYPKDCFKSNEVETEDVSVKEKDLARAIAHSLGGMGEGLNMQDIANKLAKDVFDYLVEKGL